MAENTVPVRLTYLLHPDLTASVKLVWLGLSLDENDVLRSPTRMERCIGVSRPTVRKAFRQLEEGWAAQIPPDLHDLSQTQVRIHRRLIADKSVPAMARIVYCVLLGLHQQKKREIVSSYARIARVLRLQARTVRSAIIALVNAGWLAISQATKRSPIQFRFIDPLVARQKAEVRRAEQRLQKAQFYGEALALLWCDALVDSTNYTDDHFPPALANPETGELLQADRFYADHNVAIEFNGPQHDGPTPHYPAEVVEKQIARDRLKREICNRQQIPLITLVPEDLTFQRLRELLGHVLPLRSVSANEPVIRHLTKKSRRYQQNMKKFNVMVSCASLQRQQRTVNGPQGNGKDGKGTG